MSVRLRAIVWVGAALCVAGAIACQRKDAPKRYPLHGQILVVDAAKQELTISHGDIPNFMPAMTMVYSVASPALMQGREPGETITAVLEVSNSVGRIVEVAHIGQEPLPATNQASLAGGVLGVGDRVPDTAFIDQTDRRRSVSEWNGTVTVLTFTYTHCPLPNFCPLMDQNFATLQRRLADDTILRGRVKLISVTFDPARDTPAVLAAHAAKLKADPNVWTFLTGDVATAERFAGAFGVGVIRDPQDGAQIQHNLRTAMIGADGRVLKLYPGNDWTPGAIISDLRAAVAAKQ
jgi:protein SCO1/2